MKKQSWLFAAYFVLCGLLSTTHAQVSPDDQREGDWLVRRDTQAGVQIYTREMTLHPKAEAKPALKHRFIPDRFEQIDGNAAIYYLKAMSFLEETRAREQITEFERNAIADADANDMPSDQAPPNVWYGTAPKELPVPEVKEYLAWHDFQAPLLAEATRRKSFSLDRNIRDVKNPIFYLLPEIQSLRGLARVQKIRLRLALAEDRIDDAIRIQGEQYALAKNLGGDEFLVSNLVGAAVAGMANEDALHLSEHPDAPNLYWAYASLPSPLIDMQDAMAYERQVLFEQVKSLREVDATPRSEGYWVDFLDRFQDEMEVLASMEMNFKAGDTPDISRSRFVAVVAAAYPGALQYLINDVKIDAKQVNAYPQLQTVLLAMKLFYEESRDDLFKWQYIDYHIAESSTASQKTDERRLAAKKKYGWITEPIELILPAIKAVRSAQERMQQGIAMRQTVEAIRDFAATNDNQLPKTLEQLNLPAPNDPFTGKPFQYEVNGDRAVLTGSRTASLQYRFVMRIAK